ncbi:hypothetical protein KIW84_055907 [Lathyrus oleraceus]|uniref:Uncharacterized protein n=1 Tax=Pisum sativum TaxID=3888 RepID=A0A9D5AJ15_PEA|nr:hypothetical protein KIW84_055907 [Pisum sativum]
MLSLTHGLNLTLVEKEKSHSSARMYLKAIQPSECFSSIFGRYLADEGVKETKSIGFWGENISDLESESESESEFLILGPSLPRTPISVPSLEPELSPSLSLSPSSTHESEPVSVPGPSRPSVLQESAPPAPTLVYQRRSKPDLLQKQIQSPEPEVSTENDSSSDDCAISDTCDTNPVDLPIALRKDKRSSMLSLSHGLNLTLVEKEKSHSSARMYLKAIQPSECFGRYLANEGVKEMKR